MKAFLIAGAAVVALAGITPIIAQTAQPPVSSPPARVAKTHTRAEVQSRVATRFAKLDTDRDGFVTQAETDGLIAQHEARRAERAQKRTGRRDPAKAFDRLDANKDGAISRAEFAAAPRPDRKRPPRGGMHRGAAGGMFGMSDVNRDGRVSLAEAQQAALQHFDQADSNRDGQLTREERRAARQQMRAQRPKG
jgi:hypothetical protein